MTALRWTRRALDATLLVALAAVALTAVVALAAPVTGGRAMVIGGGSMEPTIPRGALVLAVPAARYGVGDVVAVGQPGATPYTHRISRLAEHEGQPYVETRGDANEGPDPALVPTGSIIGRVDLALPLLGYLLLLLGSTAGLVGFVALGGSLLIMSGALEELDADRSCAICAAEGAGAAAMAMAGPARLRPTTGLAGWTAGLAGAAAMTTTHGPATTDAPATSAAPTLPRSPAREPAHVRVRDLGRARDPHLPVLLERDRRSPRHHGRAPRCPRG